MTSPPDIRPGRTAGTAEPDDLIDVLERAASGAVAFEDYIESPIAIEPKPRTLLILDRREREEGRPWHVLGMALLVVLVAALTVMAGRGAFRDYGAMTLAFAFAAVGVLLIVKGRPRRTGFEVPLLWMDSNLALLRVREHPEQEELTTSSNIAYEDVREVLFAQRLFRLPGARESARVDGAAVFVRLWDGAVWPLIPATLAKREAYNIALGVAQRLNVGVKQVGSGWSDRRG